MITVAWKWVGVDERWAGVSDADRAALEVGLRLGEHRDGESVTVVSVGPAGVERGLREALAAGAGRAIRVDAPRGLASAAVARAIAIVAHDSSWVVCGDLSNDRGTGSVPAFVAAELAAPQALGLVAVEIPDRSSDPLTAIRRLDGGRREVLAVPSPAVLSVEGAVAGLRRASLQGEIAARHTAIDVVAGPAGPLDRPELVRAFRPRARARAGPSGDALDRVRALTASAPTAAATETVVLDPAAAADRILAALRSWGYRYADA